MRFVLPLILDHVLASVGLAPDADPSLDGLRQELTFRVERLLLGRSVASACEEHLMGSGPNNEIWTEDLTTDYGSQKIDSVLRDVIISSCKLPDPPIIREEDLNRAIENTFLPDTHVLPLGVYQVHLTLPSLAEGIYRGTLIPSGSDVLIKCKFSNRSVIREEYFNTYLLKSEPWCPRILIPLTPTIDGHARCFGTRFLSGGDLETYPRADDGVVAWSILAGFGLQMVDTLKSLHTQHRYAHGDAHGGNWVLDDEGKLFLIDYEGIQPVRPVRARMDLRVMVASLWVLRDPSPTADISNFYRTSVDDLCPSESRCPGGLRGLVDRVAAPKYIIGGIVTDEEYELIKGFFREI
jgi:hypothetical protein